MTKMADVFVQGAKKRTTVCFTRVVVPGFVPGRSLPPPGFAVRGGSMAVGLLAWETPVLVSVMMMSFATGSALAKGDMLPIAEEQLFAKMPVFDFV